MGGGWGADREAASRWSWHRWHFLDTASLWWLGEGPPQQAWSLQCPVQSRTVSSKWCDHVLVPGSCVCGLIWESDPRGCEWLKKKKAALAEGVIHAWYLHTKETQSRGGGHGTQRQRSQPCGHSQGMPRSPRCWRGGKEHGPVRTLTLDFRAPGLGGDRVLAFEAVCAASSQQSWEAGTAPQETGLPSLRLPARCLVWALGLPPQCLLALQLGRAEPWHKKKRTQLPAESPSLKLSVGGSAGPSCTCRALGGGSSSQGMWPQHRPGDRGGSSWPWLGVNQRLPVRNPSLPLPPSLPHLSRSLFCPMPVTGGAPWCRVG